MKHIGITGGIGSGKTTVANFFKEFGIPVYIADDEAKKLMHKSPVKEELIDLFGEESFDDSQMLNRSYIASKVFHNKELLEKLNQIVHPRVEEDFQKWAKSQHSPYVLYEAAILFETGKYKQFDYTILVTAPVETRIKRVQKRDHSSEEDVLARMKNQWPAEEKMKLASWIIKNCELSKTKQEVRDIHELILRL